MENQRIRLTRKLLKDALIGLLREKQIEKITIYELCARAQVNRTTFYKYYGSQYDLLAEFENDLFGGLEQGMKSGGDSEEGLTRALTYIQAHREEILVLLSSVVNEDFALRLFNLPVIQRQLRTTLNTKTDLHKKYLSEFQCNGGYAVIRKWIREGTPESPRQIAEFILELCK